MFKIKTDNFKKASFWTIILVYLVIVAGGVVRCTGSGMGCPDWPKCFGKWIPPTQISELPANYVEIYSKGGHLTVEFNVLKTWTEYINRLIGVAIGFAIFLTLIYSISYLKSKKSIFWLSFISFILVGFQGWLGSKVVSSNLLPFMVSIHMIVALIIVCLLLYAYSLTNILKTKVDKNLKFIFLITAFATLIQILLGTQVRQNIDVIAKSMNYENRNLWIENLGNIFISHRLFAYVIILLNGYLIYKCHKIRLILIRNSLSLLIILEIISGLVLTYFNFPSLFQPVHLVLGTMSFGTLFYYYTTFEEH